MFALSIATMMLSSVSIGGTAVGIAPIQIDAKFKLAYGTPETRDSTLDRGIKSVLNKRLIQLGCEVSGAEQVEAALERSNAMVQKSGCPFLEPDLRKANGLLALGFIIVIRVESIDQKDAPAGAAMTNPAGAGSFTEVSVRTWLYDAVSSKLVNWSDNSSLKGRSTGSRIGIMDAKQLQGSPDDKDLVLKNSAKKQVEFVGKAVLNAVEPLLKTMQVTTAQIRLGKPKE